MPEYAFDLNWRNPRPAKPAPPLPPIDLSAPNPFRSDHIWKPLGVRGGLLYSENIVTGEHRSEPLKPSSATTPPAE
jgi:hypothetical protein